MKRNLLKDGFTAADFAELMGPGQGGPRIDVWAKFKPEIAQLLAQQANALLRQHLGEPVRVMNWQLGSPDWFEHSKEVLPGFKRTALLVCVEKVEGEK